MSLIIDTSILIEIENNNQDIINKVNALKDAPKAELYLTIFSFCEFYYGAINKSEKNQEKVRERLSHYKLLNTTQATAMIFCNLLHHLKKKGTPLPQFDVFISALAVEHGFTLVTADTHFKEVPGLNCLVLK